MRYSKFEVSDVMEGTRNSFVKHRNSNMIVPKDRLIYLEPIKQNYDVLYSLRTISPLSSILESDANKVEDSPNHLLNKTIKVNDDDTTVLKVMELKLISEIEKLESIANNDHHDTTHEFYNCLDNIVDYKKPFVFDRLPKNSKTGPLKLDA